MATTYIDSNGNLVTSENKKKKNTYTYIDDNGNLASAEVPNIPTTNKKKKNNAWINLTAFDDGYDFGDVTRSILGTSQDVGKNLFKGAMSAVEGINDFTAQGLGGVAHLVGAEEAAKRLRNYAGQETFTNDNVLTKTILNSGLIPGGKTLNIVDELTGQKGSKFVTEQMNKNIEKTSVLGDSSRGIAQGVGQLGGQVALQSFGVPWQVTAFTGAASNEIENAFQNDSTYGQAFTSGLISGLSEVGSEYLSGGANKFLGMTSLGSKFIDKLGGKITNKALSRGLKTILDVGGEGGEEIISGLGTAIGRKLTYMSDKDFKEIYSSEQALDDFIGGALVTAIAGVPGNVRSIARGENSFTGLTANEQKVLDKELQNRIQEQQKDGKELSQKEINKIEEQVKNDMSKGRISVETIEEALGGNNTTQNDILLQNSYNERANRSVAYNADLSKYKGKQKEIVQKAIDSGVLNNTNRSHEMVDLVAKLAEDKGMDFDFVNNEKLKDTGFALEGKQVNGYNTGTSIGINIDSNKALNSVIGHEITHVLEDTDLYNELQKSIIEYAKTKGEYDTRLKDLQELYKDVKDANVENELTSDLVGDYLFTDEDFVNRLYNNNRNVFQKIYDEIKYFVKQVAPGSKEAKQLEQVKRAFEKAYNQNTTNENSKVKYDLKENKKYGTYWNIETGKDIFKNLKTKKELRQSAIEYLKNGNENFDIVDSLNKDDTVRFIRKSGEEYVYGKNSQKLTNEEYKQKMRIAPSIDDLIDNATIKYKSPLTHDNKLFPNGYDNFQGTLKIDDNYFKYIVRLGLNKDSNSIFYDLSLENLDKQKGTDTIVPQSKRPSLINNKSVPLSEKSISQKSKNVNDIPTKYSIQENQNNTQELDNSSFSNEKNYRGSHQIENAKPITELNVDDITTKIKDIDGYLTNQSESDLRKLKKILNNPNEKVTIYRASPVNELNSGDWVTTDKSYAKNVANNNGGKVYSYEVNANELYYPDNVNDLPSLHRLSSFQYNENTQNNVKYSVSNVDNQGRELSKQQQEYFKDSKVRDEDGNLLEVYRGDDNTINVFDREKAGIRGSWYGAGFYFTSNPHEASFYGDVNNYYLDIKNPYIPSNDIKKQDGTIDFAPSFYEDFENRFKNQLPDDFKNRNDKGKIARDVLEKNGYDGVFNGTNYVAFNSNQIKNIDNTNPTTNEDIRYSLSEQNKKIAPVGNYQIKGKDVKLEKIAPVKETTKPNIPTKADIEAKEIPKNPTKETAKSKDVSIPLAKKDNVLRVAANNIAKQINKTGGFDLKERSWAKTSTESDILKDKVYIEDLDRTTLPAKVKIDNKNNEGINRFISYRLLL